MENGCSSTVWRIREKLQNEHYMKNAVSLIAEQLLFYFYSEWKENEEL